MKYSESNYPFINLIKQGKYLKVLHLYRALNYLGIPDLSDYETQHFSKTFLQDAENELDSLTDLFSLLKDCCGCEIWFGGCAFYYKIEPNKQDGLKFIIIYHGDKYSGVIAYGKSIDFVLDFTKTKVGTLIEWEIVDCYKPGLYASKSGMESLIRMFLSLITKNLFKQLVKIRICVIGLPNKKKAKINGIKIISDFPVSVYEYDKSYYTEIRSKNPFIVNKHLRNQACGPGFSEHRIIIIESYMKKGILQKARKTLKENIK